MIPSPEAKNLLTAMTAAGVFFLGSIDLKGGPNNTDAYAQSPVPEYSAPPISDKVLRCAGEVVTIVGTDGKDRIYGTPGNDVIHAGDGDDTVIAGAGNDKVCGGGGNDKLSGTGGDDRLFGDSGDDELSGGSGDDRLSGGSGDDNINDGKGNDESHGGPGDDYLRSGSGRDSLNGGAGDDQLEGRDKDTLNGNNGVDLCEGASKKLCETNRGLKLIPGSTNTVGSGKVVTYVVMAERGLASIKPKEAAKEIDEILAHPEGWTKSGVVGFKRVSQTSKAKVTFKISTPKKTDSLCQQGRVYGTNSKVSCRTSNGTKSSINLNADRFYGAVKHWPKTLTGKRNISTYRYYLVGHEMGHVFKFGENNNSVCTRKGGLAPLMQQQTKYFLGCEPNFFPLASEIDTLRGRYHVNR